MGGCLFEIIRGLIIIIMIVVGVVFVGLLALGLYACGLSVVATVFCTLVVIVILCVAFFAHLLHLL